jgi:hypothetical protein
VIQAQDDGDLPPLKTAEDVLKERWMSADEVKRSLNADDPMEFQRLVERQNANNSGSTWWFANIYRNSTKNPYFYAQDWVLWRNVKDFGAVGVLQSTSIRPLTNESR